MSSESDLLPRVMSLAVHELRTPLSVVDGYLRMLLREHAGPLNERQRHILEQAAYSCDRLTTLVTEMSSLGKLMSGRSELARQEVDIAALLAEVASGMHEGEDRGVRLELRGTDQPVVVIGDRLRLASAVKALMHSALRERGEPGAIVAQCSTFNGDGVGYAVVTVGDESLLPALTRNITANPLAFDEYREGTGFALPLARQVIEGHGGAVWSAATAQELSALDPEHTRLSYDERKDLIRKRAASALRLPLRT